MSVQMHPQASRHAVPPSSTSSAAPSPLASSPFFPKLDSIFPNSSSTRRHAQQQHQSHAHSNPTPLDASRQTSPRGLQVDASIYPLYSLSHHAPQIRVLSASEYADLHERDSRAKLDEKELFPWSHGGADVPDSAASKYFGFGCGQAAKTPNYRGLTTIKAPPVPTSSRSNGAPGGGSGMLRRKLTSSFTSWTSSSSTSNLSSTSTSATSDRSASASPTPSPSSYCRLVSSFDAAQILETDPSSGQTIFKLPQLPAQVNLRHFALQAAKYATISDVVVYGQNGIDESVVETARQVREAMDFERDKRGGRGLYYNVYIIAQPFSVFELEHPKLVAFDSLGFRRNALNFFDREKEEMRALTEASQIGENVWLGNSQDVPIVSNQRSRSPSPDSASSLLDDGNPLSYAVCIEVHDSAPLHSSNILGQAEHALDVLQEQGQAYEDVQRLLQGEQVYHEKTTIVRPQLEDIIHLEALSSPMSLGNSHRARTAYVHKTVDLALWIRDQASPAYHTNRLPRRILLHCPDGYTETTLLALTYVMINRRCHAAEAYLYLQEDSERSFYVYPTDKETILKLEQRVKDILAREDEEEDRAIEWHNSQRAVESAGMERSDSGFVDSTDDTITVEHKPISLPQRTEMRLSSPSLDPWFFGQTFEGHFPSRILPYLYLGNLNHASNALMLKELGITHVVSLGESALTPPTPPSFSFSKSFNHDNSSTPDRLPQNSLWLEERLGNISVLDLKNFADDGIDSIQPHIDEAIEFIDEAHRRGGKILVHCKVGVSRSASIVIAYMMKHVGLDLASSYLLTRSRRLNILIQPNLPFMAALHAFEASLLDQQQQQLLSTSRSPSPRSSASSSSSSQDDTDPLDRLAQPGLKRSNRLGWSFLCSEVAKLNERFLC
ncbi:tyrosine/serine/threonine protein phosphatase PPS1 [Sporobolomyces salmoneus]|uniref:tyrosine/serine/threonine protein phosphatase PPS1 n=1 Tax=Sporobolomyces salmoneus TaxID=183962 RepID=UPI003177B4B0